jgi:hypothetical protein
MTIRPIALAATVALGAALLTGCSSGGGTAPDASDVKPRVTTQEVTPVEETTPEPTETEAAPAPVAGEITPAGAVLAIGDPAWVVWNHFSGEEINLQVAVKSVVAGSLSDVLPLLSDSTAEQVQGYTPYYVTLEYTKTDLSQRSLEFSSSPSYVYSFDSDGSNIPELIMFGGGFELCDDNWNETVDQGAPQTACYVFMLAGGKTFGGVQWADNDTVYDRWDGSPIVWK